MEKKSTLEFFITIKSPYPPYLSKEKKMDQSILSFDIQYLALAELSYLDESNIAKSDWEEIIDCFCVCRLWNSSLQQLLAKNNPARVLLGVSKSTGQFSLERAAADYKARGKANKGKASLLGWTPTVFAARQEPDNDNNGDPLINDLGWCMRIASYRGYIACMRICLDTDIQQLSDCHPEDWVRNAIEGDSLPAVKLLLEDDVADVNEALGYAIELRRVSIVDFLLDRGADPNIRIYAFVTNFEHSLSPVSYAGYSNDAVLMRVLLDHGLDVEDPDYDLRPIFWAIKYNNLDMARMLIYRGADISPQEYDLDWPLSQAIRFGRREIVQLLLDKGGPLRPSIDSEWLLRLVEDYGDEQVKQLFPHGLLDIPRN